MAKYILAAFLLSTAIAICIKAEERIETITFLTSYCDDCGMDFTGSVAVKVIPWYFKNVCSEEFQEFIDRMKACG